VLLLKPFYIQTCWNIQLPLLKEEDNLVDLSNVLALPKQVIFKLGGLVHVFGKKETKLRSIFFSFHFHVEMLSFSSIIFVQYYLQNLNQ
jgi:hypothetical protein